MDVQTEWTSAPKPTPEGRSPYTTFEGGVIEQIKDSEERLTKLIKAEVQASEERLTQQIEDSEKRLRKDIRKILNHLNLN